MSKTKALSDTSVLKAAYYDLSESKKGQLRADFMEKFEYSLDSFYKKLSGDTPLWKNEKSWLAEQLNKSIVQLFPETSKKVVKN